jgi:hypothetical protein
MEHESVKYGGGIMTDEIGTGGYESMVWIRDKEGKEYACYLDALKGNIKTKDQLTEEERAKCLDVSEIVGTERW